MAELPQNWIETELVNITNLYTGNSINESVKKEKYTNLSEGFNYIATKDIGYDKSINYKNGIKIPFEETSFKIAPKGSVLLCIEGGSAGRKLAFTNEDVCFVNKLCAFVSRISTEHAKFIYYYFQSNDFKAIFNENKNGLIGGVSLNKLKQIKIIQPPLNEQKRIVEKLDKIIRIVDGVNARLDKIPTALKRARQSILNQAITGELTKDWREKNLNIIPASIMIEKFKQSLLESSSNNEKDKINNIFSFKENYFSFDIPHTWTFSILEKLSKSFKYGTSTKSESSGLVPVLRMGNIQKGEIDWNDLVYTSDSKEIEKYKLEKNDVLFNRTNSPELVGKTAIYRGERAAIYAGYLIKIENYKILNSEYLNYALNSTFAKEWKLDVKTDGVSQSNINAQKLAKFEVPLPPLEEQAEIVRRVKLAFEKLDKIESRYRKAKEYSDKLTQSILNKAFRGELVPQDPNDKPIEIEV